MNDNANLEPPVVAAPTRTSGLAVASLVFGILGFILLPIVGAILAVVFGHVARDRMKRDPTLGGGGLALAGLILGWIEVAFLGLAIILVLLVTIASSAG